MMKDVGRRVMGASMERTPVKWTTCGRLEHTATNFYMLRPCIKCGRYGHFALNCGGSNLMSESRRVREEVDEVSGLAGSEQVLIPQSEPFTMVKEEWSTVERGSINMIEGEHVLVGQDTDKNLLHAKALLTKERKSVTVLIDTRSSCNILQKRYYKKHGFVVHLCQKELNGFNGSTSKVLGPVKVLVSIKKWSALLPFYVLENESHPIIRYVDLKKRRLSVNCVLDSLVKSDGDKVICNMMKMRTKIAPKRKDINQEKETNKNSLCTHITFVTKGLE